MKIKEKKVDKVITVGIIILLIVASFLTYRYIGSEKATEYGYENGYSMAECTELELEYKMLCHENLCSNSKNLETAIKKQKKGEIKNKYNIKISPKVYDMYTLNEDNEERLRYLIREYELSNTEGLQM